MKRLLSTICVFAFASQVHAQNTKITPDNKAIYQVLHTFMESIIKGDTASFSSLFAPGPVAWVAINSKENIESIRKVNPEVKLVSYGDHKKFMRFIAAKGLKEEKFYNVRITKDDYLASASFDYSFWEDGKKINWGKENWDLIFDGVNWKIAGVYYSLTMEKFRKEPPRFHYGKGKSTAKKIN